MSLSYPDNEHEEEAGSSPAKPPESPIAKGRTENPVEGPWSAPLRRVLVERTRPENPCRTYKCFHKEHT